MANQKQSEVAFLIYKDWYGMFKLLSAEQLQVLVYAVFDYQLSAKELQTDDGKLKMAWEIIKATFIRDNKKYEDRCKKNSEKAKKRWQNPDETEADSQKSAYDLSEFELKALKSTPNNAKVMPQYAVAFFYAVACYGIFLCKVCR